MTFRESTRQSSRRLALVLPPVLIAVFAIGAVGMAVVAANLNSKLDRERGDRHQVEAASSQLASRLLTYDYRHLDDTKGKVLAYAAGKFRDDYQQQFPTIQQIIVAVRNVDRGETPRRL